MAWVNLAAFYGTMGVFTQKLTCYKHMPELSYSKQTLVEEERLEHVTCVYRESAIEHRRW